MKYIAKKEDVDLVDLAFAGYRGLKGKRFDVKYKTQFDEIAPGLYQYYQIMCDISHGAMAAHLLKSDLSDDRIELDTGIVCDPERSTFIINQLSVYLLAHLEFMRWVFPEIDKKKSESYEAKKHEVLAVLWRMMKEISEKDRNKNWYDAVKHLVNI